ASRATVVLGGAHASAAGGCGALTDPLKATVEKVRAPSLNFMSSVKAVLPSLARTCVPSSVTLTVLAAGRAGRAETSRLGPSARKSPNSGKKNVPGDPVEEYSAFDGIVAAPDMIVAAATGPPASPGSSGRVSSRRSNKKTTCVVGAKASQFQLPAAGVAASAAPPASA